MSATRIITILVLGLMTAGSFAADEPKYGTLEVVSVPSGARVYIEGFLAGRTPVKAEQIVPGDYRVVVKEDTHDDFVQDVTATAGETSRVDVQLTPNTGVWKSPVRDEDDWTPVMDDKKPYEKAKSRMRLRDYKTLEIANFLGKSDKDEEVPPDHLYAFLRDLAIGLDKKTKFEKFITNYTRGPSERWAESDTGGKEPRLILSGVITRYQRGSRTKRYVVGFGAGKTRAYSLFRLVDKRTNEVLFERMENGSVSMGIFGGGSAGAMKELGEDIAKAITKNW